MSKKVNKFPPLRNNEVRMLEMVNNTCLSIMSKLENGESVDISPQFLHLLCSHNLILYSRLIDANYVRRPLSPLVPLDIIH